MSEVNPYSTPGSQVGGIEAQEFGEIKILSASGRLGRVRYIGYSMGIFLLISFGTGILMAALGALFGESSQIPFVVSIIAVVLLAYFFTIILAIQRLHDFEASGWLSIIAAIPYIGGLFMLALMVIPGTQGPNRFGPVPPPNTLGAVILAVIVPAIIVLGIVAAIAIPYFAGIAL